MIVIDRERYTVTIKGNRDEILKVLDKLLVRNPPMIRFELGFTPNPTIMVEKWWYDENLNFAEELEFI